jgi:PAS domain S-box-containing protein
VVTTMSSVSELLEYRLVPLREGSEFILYRGWQTGEDSPVLAVVLAAEQPSSQSIRRLEHEYSLRADLDPAWAAKPLALARHDGRPILVLKDPGGEPLDQILERNQEQPLDMTCFLRVAIGLTKALGQVHRQGLIHKDIKPANVLVNDGDVWLTGFGIASKLPRERQAPAPPEIIAGTLAYMAPEQTGRMNRSIDTRTDLYSLGITLYQMLAGRLPFAAADPLEWVHCHIARQPAPLDVKIPAPLIAIITRLLSKNAEERYQTAMGLELDLRRCLKEWEMRSHIDSFPLGTHDVPDRFLIPEKLYGRDHEVNTLLAAFGRVMAHGTRELILISGYSGVGKSSVVNELHRVLVPPRGLFAAGKFDQYKRDIPYATLAQAFQTLVRQILIKNEVDVDQWRADMREALGPNGQLIVNLVPELELLIGKQSTVSDLPPKDAQSRFQMVFRRFLGVFARKEHPLALFLDDLQWLDAATLDLLEDLLTLSDVRYLLLIGAYRDNEVDSTHPLTRTLEATRRAGATVQNILLAPLTAEDLSGLLVDSLHCEPDRVAPLAQLVHKKTAGNPFFAIQFLSALAEEGLLTFDHENARWSWDLYRIHAKGYTDNVVDLMIAKLNRLPKTTRVSLKQLACLGNSAAIAVLSMICGESEERLHDVLWEAVCAGLVSRSEETYAFIHDRVHEAAYALIPEDERATEHLRIGRLLSSRTTEEELEEKVFEIVNQLNHGSGLITSHEERERVAELNLTAGMRAKASAAYASALSYLTVGSALLTEESWERLYTLTFELKLQQATCELLTANLAVAEELVSELLEKATSKADKARVYRLKIELYVLQSELPRAIESTLECLNLFGIQMSPHPSRAELESAYEDVWTKIGERSIEALVDLPRATDPDVESAMSILSALFAPAVNTDETLAVLHLCHMVTLTLELGVTEASTYAFGWFGIMIGYHFHRYADGYRFGELARALVQRHNFTGYEAKTLHSLEVVSLWTHPISIAINSIRAAFVAGVESGDITVACYACNHIVSDMLLRGDYLDVVWQEVERGLVFARRAKFYSVIEILLGQQRFIQNMRGYTTSFSTFNDEEFDETSFERNLAAQRMAITVFWYWVIKGYARFMSGDFDEAARAFEHARPLQWTSPAHIQNLDYHLMSALTLTALDKGAEVTSRAMERHAQIRAHREQLARWVESCPATFADKLSLVDAEMARIEQRELDAEHLYEEAMQLAHANGFIQYEALANELAARFYLGRGFKTIAYTYLRNARNCYDRWGALGKVRQLDLLYPHLHEKRDSISPLVTIGASIGQLDVATVVKASQALSSEIVLPKLIEKLMRIAIEHAGAERGLLILFRGDEPQIEAEATTGYGGAQVAIRQKAVTTSDLLNASLHYVIRTRERVVLDDASTDNLYFADEYVQEKHPKSVLCLPIVKQTKLVGALYFENNLTPDAFTSDRVAILEMLASQAAISLENASLYSDLKRSEAFLAQGQSISHTGSFGFTVFSRKLFWSDETYNILGFDRAVKPTVELVRQRIHPDDRGLAQRALSKCDTGVDIDFEHRLLMPDNSVKHLHVIARALSNASGNTEYLGVVTDITAAKRAESKIRQSEMELRQILNFVPQHVGVIGADCDRTRLYANQVALDYFGFTLEEWQSNDRSEHFHPDDWKRLREESQDKFLSGLPHESEVRLRRSDGKYRWFLFRWNPLRDEHGRLMRWYLAATDIEERKLAEQRLVNENVALREENDKASMFEEIVGTSPRLQTVLSRISKVAPTDSSVLITGETGTGKELVARAIHRRSRRSSHAFVSVNCAAIPRDLIASELFGHEKGAFTGATQRRIGRFELAEGGTLFLDEFGELPPETQIALLRVLQEHEFERVGGTGTIHTNVRVIAATNRDLEAAIAQGTFRSDLYYRLSVFPIEMPALRERKEDIPLLVEYFIDRYARKAGKSFSMVDRKSLVLLESYQWPGNIRELQNVIERSVIVCETETFSVDESWLSQQPLATTPDKKRGLFKKDLPEEKATIEAALRESGGQVYGAAGAAARLGIPRSTLESKIRSLKINKYRFKATDPNKNN